MTCRPDLRVILTLDSWTPGDCTSSYFQGYFHTILLLQVLAYVTISRTSSTINQLNHKRHHVFPKSLWKLWKRSDGFFKKTIPLGSPSASHHQDDITSLVRIPNQNLYLPICHCEPRWGGGGGAVCRSEKKSTPLLLQLSWGGGKFSGVKSAAFLDNLGGGFKHF